MVVILGLGFTGTRLARRLLRRRIPVSAAARATGRFQELAGMGLQLFDWSQAALLPRGSTLAVLVPPLPEPENALLRNTICKLAPRRLVYVSSTGVYGGRTEVDWTTLADPNDERGRRRLEEERWMASGQWTSLILRSAAIYGPGRGVHASLRHGKLPRGTLSGMVSRIHVDDLAAIVEAGIFSAVQGEWPVADDVPCPSADILHWCARMLRLSIPVDSESAQRAEKKIGGRKVDGAKIREVLEVSLEYPSWRSGVPASLAEEDRTA